MKRLVVVSDYHCGHRAGLCPPEWQYVKSSDRDREKFRREQDIMWRWYAETCKKLQPVDILVVNGDAIDGKGDKSGGTEQIEMARDKQVDMAAACIAEMQPAKIVMIYGTGYHVGKDEDWEAVLAEKVGAAKIGAHEWVRIEGVTFDFKHKVSRSVIPHGRWTGPQRAALWNALWAERGVEPRADVLVRCLSGDTEILTKRGWLGREAISLHDEAMTLNTETEKLEWNRVEAITTNTAYPIMCSIRAKGYDALVTPDHNMVYRCQGGEIKTRIASELAKMAVPSLPVSGVLDRNGVDLSDAMIKILAWVIAEGNMDAGNMTNGYPEKNNVRIIQRCSRTHEIEEALKEEGLPYTKHIRKCAGYPLVDGERVYHTQEDISVLYIRQPHSRRIIKMLGGQKQIPDWLMDMNKQQFDLFLATYLRGDGYAEGNGGKIFTGNKNLANQLQILLVTNGYKAKIWERHKWNKVNYVIGFTEKRWVSINQARRAFHFVPYTGATWCVSVKNGTIMTRRNGSVAIVGNSHVHYHVYGGDGKRLVMTTPCLQGFGSKYGVRECEGLVDIGFVHFDCTDGGYTWEAHLLDLIPFAPQLVRL